MLISVVGRIRRMRCAPFRFRAAVVFSDLFIATTYGSTVPFQTMIHALLLLYYCSMNAATAVTRCAGEPVKDLVQETSSVRCVHSCLEDGRTKAASCRSCVMDLVMGRLGRFFPLYLQNEIRFTSCVSGWYAFHTSSLLLLLRWVMEVISTYTRWRHKQLIQRTSAGENIKAGTIRQ